jgi:hypothetical protein
MIVCVRASTTSKASGAPAEKSSASPSIGW